VTIRIFGSTVGYPSDSLASCLMYQRERVYPVNGSSSVALQCAQKVSIYDLIQ